LLVAQNNATARAYAVPAEKRERTAPPPAREQSEVLRRPKQHPKQAPKVRSRIKVIVMVLLVFGVCAGLVTRYVQLTQINSEINKLDAELKKEQTNLEELELQKTYATNLSQISANASTKLGMDFPKPGQIVYINLQQDGNGQNNEAPGNQ
jgi:cell division protein FtsL